MIELKTVQQYFLSSRNASTKRAMSTFDLFLCTFPKMAKKSKNSVFSPTFRSRIRAMCRCDSHRMETNLKFRLFAKEMSEFDQNQREHYFTQEWTRSNSCFRECQWLQPRSFTGFWWDANQRLILFVIDFYCCGLYWAKIPCRSLSYFRSYFRFGPGKVCHNPKKTGKKLTISAAALQWNRM